MLQDDIFFASAADLGRDIRARRLSPVELTEGYLERIRRHAPALNAFATVTGDLALEQARTAEREISRGLVRGPLHGVPYGAKDLLATAGIPTTWGARPTKNQVFDRDATVVRKLREAGAVLLGKLAMVEFAGCLGYRMGDASLQGPMRNPWDHDRWTGGSSSGSGAAVAAGLVGFAIGTETWGSILCPSAFCGITGLRPTYGRVSRAGGMVGSWTLDKIGPMARSAEDCRLILQAIAGADPDDPTASEEPVRLDPARRDWKHLRGAVIPTDFEKTPGAEHEVGEAFEDAVATLRDLGLPLETATLPDFPASEVTTAVLYGESISAFERFFRDGTVSQLIDPYAPYQERILRGMSGGDYTKAQRMRRRMQEKMADFFGRYDVIVATNFLSVAPPMAKDFYETLPYPDPVGAFGNGCGLPAIALPSKPARDGLPAGFQIMGSAWDEGLLLDLGEAYQRRTDHHRRQPPAYAARAGETSSPRRETRERGDVRDRGDGRKR
jgi:aspartyl-tRNA(Asn)/glutamyl-tRNA(Gln) amidotransferase subunit A